jgi:NAD(P)-dependent dehydrogenase (short-subunit alcohol dehydrogenase family)
MVAQGGETLMARVVVVTGAFGALGRVVAETALAADHSVAALDFAKVPALGVDPRMLAMGGVDLADPAAATTAMEGVIARFGRIDVLLNIAGGFRWETLEAGDVATWELMHRLNLLTCLNASRAALPHLAASGAGTIVNVGAGAALKAGAGMGAYAASKSAVHRLTEALAEEWKGRGLTVNAVLPSTIDTPANRADMPDADFGKWVTPADLAGVMLFLAGPAARSVTGALVPVVGAV